MQKHTMQHYAVCLRITWYKVVKRTSSLPTRGVTPVPFGARQLAALLIDIHYESFRRDD